MGAAGAAPAASLSGRGDGWWSRCRGAAPAWSVRVTCLTSSGDGLDFGRLLGRGVVVVRRPAAGSRAQHQRRQHGHRPSLRMISPPSRVKPRARPLGARSHRSRPADDGPVRGGGPAATRRRRAGASCRPAWPGPTIQPGQDEEVDQRGGDQAAEHDHGQRPDDLQAGERPEPRSGPGPGRPRAPSQGRHETMAGARGSPTRASRRTLSSLPVAGILGPAGGTSDREASTASRPSRAAADRLSRRRRRASSPPESDSGRSQK